MSAFAGLGPTVRCFGMVLLAAAAGAQPPKRAPASDLKAVAGLIEAGQLDPAERQLRRLLAQGDSPAARSLLGLVLVKEGRADEAERELKAALAANPALLAARQHLVRLYLAQKRDADATAELRRAARLGPLDRDLGLKLAGVELAEGHIEAATRQLRSVADRFKSVQALLQLARLQSGQKDAGAALDTLGQARALAPNSEEVLSAYAEASQAARGPRAAIPVLDVLIRLCPTAASYRYSLGVALLRAGDAEGAVSALQEADRLEANQPRTLVALGAALNDRELPAEARTSLLRAVSLAPDDIDALAALAESEVGAGELKEAETHAERVLSRESGHATANLVRGIVLMRQERYAEARDVLSRAAAADPASWKADHYLSQACAALGDAAGSEKHAVQSRAKRKAVEEQVRELRKLREPAPGAVPH